MIMDGIDPTNGKPLPTATDVDYALRNLAYHAKKSAPPQTPKQLTEEDKDKLAINEISDAFSMEEALNIFNKRIEAHSQLAVEEMLDRLSPDEWKDDETIVSLTRNDIYVIIQAEREHNKIKGKV